MRKRLENAAQEVHDELGSQWSESVYHSALERELSERGIPMSSEGTISVMYKGTPVGRRRPDLFVPTDTGMIIVELKAGSTSGSVQLAQYLDMAASDENFESVRGGCLIQFNEELEFEFAAAGATDSHDSLDVEHVRDLPNGVNVFRVSGPEHEIQFSVNEMTEQIKPDANAAERAESNDEYACFMREAATLLARRVNDGS